MTTANRILCFQCLASHGEVVDASGTSTTVYCRKCYRYVLHINHPAIGTAIPLRIFHLHRGEYLWVRPFDDLRLATELVQSLLHHSPLSQEMVEMFGIRTKKHVNALLYAVRYCVTAYDLDRVMGDGTAISHLVRAIPYQPFLNLKFGSFYEMTFEKQKCEMSGWRREEE